MRGKFAHDYAYTRDKNQACAYSAADGREPPIGISATSPLIVRRASIKASMATKADAVAIPINTPLTPYNVAPI